MCERSEIIEFVDSIFDTVDAKDWGTAEKLFEPAVSVDFTMWEVWGAYDIPLRRTEAGWKATGMAFHAWHSRGDESVRTHVLS